MQVDIDLKTGIIILLIFYGIYQDRIHAFFRLLDRFMEMGDQYMGANLHSNPNQIVPMSRHSLISQNNVLYLYTSNTPLIPGVNPIMFSNYNDYAQYVAYRNQYGANIPMLPVTHMNMNTNTNMNMNAKASGGNPYIPPSQTERREKKPEKRTYYSDNAMEPNWGGTSYSMSSVNQGTYM